MLNTMAIPSTPIFNRRVTQYFKELPGVSAVAVFTSKCVLRKYPITLLFDSSATGSGQSNYARIGNIADTPCTLVQH